jgi:CRP-like cAMP-binding protein
VWSSEIYRFNIERYMKEPRRGRKVISLSKGAAVFVEGDSNDFVFFILEGSIKLTVSSPAGKEVIINLMDGGNFFGESCVVNGFPKCTYRAVALSHVTLARYDRASMVHLLQTNEAILYCFVEHLIRSLGLLQENLSSSFLYPAGKRLARILVFLSRLAGDPRLRRSFPQLGQEELAQMIGATRQHVNANLMKLKEEGHVEYARGLKDFKVNKSLTAVAGLGSGNP